jgi:hypothetical protein
MARANLGDLLGKVEDPPQVNPTKPEREPTPQVEAPAPNPEPQQDVPKPISSRPPKREASVKTEKPGPAYLRLVRKETRLREDQQNQLTLAARRLNRAKAAGTPRITDNTLIRVAIDMLLQRIERASGDDETSLLESLNQ